MPSARLVAVLLSVAAFPAAGPRPPVIASPVADPRPPLACTQLRQSRLVAAAVGDRVATLATRDTGVAPRPGGRVAAVAGGIGAVTELAPEPRRMVRVQSAAELEDTLRSGFTGTVMIPRDVTWDLSGRRAIPLRSGIALVGERGALCSRPTLFTDSKEETQHLFEVVGSGIRVEGLHLRGPAAGSRSAEQPYVTGIQVVVDRAAGTGRGVFIVDNEFDEWTGGGVEVRSTMVARTPGQYLPAWPRPTRADADQVRIQGNYMHHNARDGGGYGVVVGKGAYALIWGNLFDANRHAVASDGYAHSGYIARFNYVLEGGFMQGSYWNQHFDVHGTNPVDTTDRSSGYGGPAGEYYEIAFNTVRGDQGYYAVKTRPVFMLRGEPTEGAVFDANVVVHEDLDGAVALKWDKDDSGIGEDHDRFNFSAGGNSFGTDTHDEMAVGDFDGDGRSDVFLATGTAWFVSRGGVEPWQFLHPSTKRLRELALADMNHDGVTDVVWRAPDGALGYLPFGAGAVVPLTTSPVPVGDLRFGDFDGDGKTDIFRREPSGQWMIWSGATASWTAAQHSALPLAALRFGEFDGTRGTDVVASLSDGWKVASGARVGWAPLNRRLVRSFDEAVVGDFDGDGRSDLGFDLGRQQWVYSAGGRGPLRTLREGPGQTPFRALRTMLIGRFAEGERADQMVAFWDPFGVSVGDWSRHLVRIRAGQHSNWVLLSRMPMR